MSNTDNRTATQRIEDLEKVVTALYQATNIAQKGIEDLFRSQSDIPIIKEALKLLNKRTEAIIQVSQSNTGITVDSVNAVVTQMNVQDLTAQVEAYVSNGYVVAAETVSDTSYLVCEEYDTEGNLTNPRVQFRLDAHEQAIQDAFKGKRVGDTVSFGEGKYTAKVTEVYALVQPAAPEAAAPEATGAAETPAAAPVEAPTEPAPAPAVETSAAAPALASPPEESPVSFGLQVHGQPDPSTGETLTAGN